MKINDYKIIKQIAKGAFSEIFLAKKDKKLFVIKKISNLIENFNKIQNEINSLNIMNKYKNPISFYGWEKHNNFIYLVFDYIEKGDLNFQILNGKVLSTCDINNFLLDILEQIEFIYSHNRLHFDITPFNILEKDNKFFLIDWGISDDINSISSLFHKGHKIYTAPEIYNGHRNLYSEIYSLGCCLYFILTKNNIFNLVNEDSLIKKIYAHQFLFPDITNIKNEKFKYLILRILEKDYTKRATIKEIRYILNEDFIIPNDYKYFCKYYNFNSNLNDFEMCQELSSSNNDFANDTLGLFYEDGVNTKQDMVKAYLTYRNGAEKKYLPSISSLGVLYLKGKGVKQNFEKAYELFLESSTYPKSQYFIALMIEKNLCRNENNYIYWYKKAAFNGFELAVKKLIDLKIKVDF